MTFTARVRAIEAKFSERMPVFKAALDARGPRWYRRYCIREASARVAIETRIANTAPRNRGRVATLRSQMRWESK